MKLIKHRKILLVITIVLIAIICTSVWGIMIHNENKEIVKKQESQAPTSATQFLEETETRSVEEKKIEIDEKMKSILVGILKYEGETEEAYNEEKVDSITNQFNYHNGIFVSNRAKDKIIELLKETTNIEYTVDYDGYLKNSNNNETNDISKNINKLIAGEKTIIVDYNQYYYCKLGEDICTFNIEETQYMQKFKEDNTIIMVLNPIKYEQEYESNNDLVNQIINNIDN